MACGTVTSPAATRWADHGHLRHDPAADPRVPHGTDAPNYVINDPFFPAANGTFLNQQYLVAARASIGTAAGSPTDLAQHAVVDANGFPNQTYPPQHPDTEVKDAQLTQACETPTTKPGRGPRWLRGQTPPTEKPTLRHPRPDPADRRRPESEHRRPADSRKHQLELVLRRAGRRCRHPGRCSIPPSAAELLGRQRPVRGT